MMQLESFLLKGRPFPIDNSVTAIPFLAELETQSLSGTHDVDFVRGAVRLFAERKKRRFPACGVRRYIPTPATSARGTMRHHFQHDRRSGRAHLRQGDEPACVLPRVRRGRTAGGGRYPPCSTGWKNTSVFSRRRQRPRGSCCEDGGAAKQHHPAGWCCC